MSTKALNWARKQSFGNLALTALVTALAARADDRGVTWISQATLASDMGASDRRIRHLLKKAEYLRIITRKPRSAGAKGRLSDVTSLALNVEFNMTSAEARKALATGTPVPLGVRIRNRNKSTLATGTPVPGNIKGETYLYQGGTELTEGTSSSARPRLAVVGGTALAREGGQ